MKFQTYLFVVSVIGVFDGVAARIWYNVFSLGKGSRSLEYLGSVDGKMYFSERENHKTWLEAREACESTLVGTSSMEMPTVETEAQAQLLQSAYDDYGPFRLLYWTAARDSQLPRALSWDDDESEVKPLFSIQWEPSRLTYQLCGIYSSYTKSSLQILNCDLDPPNVARHQTFCQIEVSTFCPLNPTFEGCMSEF